MKQSQFSLLASRRFAPLFITQFLGAFHDNLFKNAFVGVLLYTTLFGATANSEILVTLATGIFILPFLLFSAVAGNLADKYPKDHVIRVVKIAEILIAILGIAALLLSSVALCFVTLFALGTQSAFFGPSKYSILPQHLQSNELIGGNALLSTGTFLAILLGTIAGLGLVTLPYGIELTCVLLLLISLVGYICARFIPLAPAGAPELKLSFNILRETKSIISSLMTSRKAVVRAAFGVGWFWFLGAVFLSQIANFGKHTLGVNEHVVILFMVLFSIGIAAGGLLNNRLLRGRVEAVYVPLAALGITIFSIDLYFAGHAFGAGPADALLSLPQYLASAAGWRITLDLFLIAVFSGMFVVPLNAIIQHNTPETIRSRVMAGSAILNSGFVVASSVVSAALLLLGFTVPQLFLIVALANFAVTIYICRLLPDYLFKTLLQVLFKFFYAVEVRGLENFDKAGERAVVVGNHVSFLDAPLLAAFLPGRPMFAVNSFVAEWFWVKPFLRLVDAFPLNPANPFSLKSLIREVEGNKHCVIFPEGRLTETGALMKIYEGPGMIADKANAVILPVRLDGVQHTPFARLKGKVPLRTFPKITITILEPRSFSIPPAFKGRTRRRFAARALYDLMEDMMFLTKDRDQTLFEALLKARHVNGDQAIILEDAERKPMKFKLLLRGAVVLGRKIAGLTTRGENVGLMLPNSIGAVVTFFALQAIGRVPAMMNFSAGAKNILSAANAAQVKTILTSRRFVTMGRLEPLIAQLETACTIVYLEDVRASLNLRDKIRALYAHRDAAGLHARAKVKPSDPAVILFTSGSEGTPKGVVLSHSNLMSNIVQLSSRVDFNRQDIVFNCLPMFHSFGLTGGALLPILSGVRTFLYPSPLHYRIVPELVYSSNATIMFGTDTFLNGYARMADPYDFYRMRYIFAGAERVKPETRALYAARFGVRILEGYGATETAPVLAVNSPMHTREGTVGRFLSGIEYRLEDVPGITEGGRLFVKGPNIMLGYYKDDQPGILQPPPEGWYDTGDIVAVDGEGYVKILGRAKRFAKIAGEMISLTAAESLVTHIRPEAQHAIIALPDPKKGEQLILLTTAPDLQKSEITQAASAQGLSELIAPKTILMVDKLPLLGSGKADYPAIKLLAEEILAGKT